MPQKKENDLLKTPAENEVPLLQKQYITQFLFTQYSQKIYHKDNEFNKNKNMTLIQADEKFLSNRVLVEEKKKDFIKQNLQLNAQVGTISAIIIF